MFGAGVCKADVQRLTSDDLAKHLGDPYWRLNNLYHIIDKDEGQKVLFRMNRAQDNLYRSMHNRNIVLKARQLGMSTFVCLFFLDQCLFNPNTSAGVVAHKLQAAEHIFKSKIKYPYENLPDEVKAMVSTKDDSARMLTFSNDSSIEVDQSLRSGTKHLLLVSEYGHTCARDPEKAREVRTGALNVIAPTKNNVVFIESTAEGQEGHFFQLCEEAQTKERQGGELTLMDYRLHFYGWFWDASYTLDANVAIPVEYQEYFAKLEKMGIELTDGQKAWYVVKAQEQGDDMKREYPSFVKEAFEGARDGSYFGQQMAILDSRGRIGPVPHDPRYPVDTFWDIGRRDATAIWFFQRIGMENCFLRYYENDGEDAPHYVKKLIELSASERYAYGTHYLPHDAGNQTFCGSTRQRLKDLRLPGQVRVGQRIDDKSKAIEAARMVLPTCRFDAQGCDQGLKRLRNYRKEWDSRRGVWKPIPLHDENSHGADAFMEFATNFQPRSRHRRMKYRTDKMYA